MAIQGILTTESGNQDRRGAEPKRRKRKGKKRRKAGTSFLSKVRYINH